MRFVPLFMLLPTVALAQQPQVLPLTEWRAQIDYELGKIPMSREAHGQVIMILQAAERAAQQQKQHEEKK